MKYKPGDKFIVEVESIDRGYYQLRGGFHTCDAVLDSYEPYDETAAYQRGLNDAWEAASRILLLKASDVGTVFNMPYWFDVFKNYSAQEAIAKLCAHEDAQVIRVGDEVTCEGYVGKAVVTYVNDEDATILHWLGGASRVEKDHLTKTGRSFPEVAALLEKMKGDADESN